MPVGKGRSRALTLPRRLVVDLLHFSRHRPLIPMERRMSLLPLAAARQQAAPRPGWCALFTKAFAAVSTRRPALRDCYLRHPWPRIYRYHDSIAAVIVERPFDDEHVLLPIYLRNADQMPLMEIEKLLQQAKAAPIESVKSFQRALRIGRYPRPVRRFIWWLALECWGRQRAKFFGTFGVSVTAGMGAGQLAVLSPATITLHYGVFEADGVLPVRATFDHRVLDGGEVARALVELEQVLLEELLPEVKQLNAGGEDVLPLAG